MRDLHELDGWRRCDAPVFQSYGTFGDGTCGMFEVPSPVDGQKLLVVASVGLGWEHVSVSRRRRTPTWGEMDYIKRKFFKDDEVAVQYHVAVADHVDIHPNCLHLWRSMTEFPLPLKLMV